MCIVVKFCTYVMCDEESDFIKYLREVLPVFRQKAFAADRNK